MFFKSSNFFAKGTFLLLLIFVFFLVSLAFTSNKFVSLTFLKPVFEERLGSYNENLDVQLEKIELAKPFLFNAQGNLNFILTDVRIVNKQGSDLTSIPKISISLKFLDFLRGDIVFTRLRVGGLTTHFLFSNKKGLHNEFASNYEEDGQNIWEDVLRPIFFAGSAEPFKDLHIFDSRITIDNLDTRETFEINVNKAIFSKEGDAKNGMLDFFVTNRTSVASGEDINSAFPYDLKCDFTFNQKAGEQYLSLEDSACELDQVSLNLLATVEFSEDIQFDGQVTVLNFNAEYLKSLWGEKIGSDFARDWITSNLLQADFPEVKVQFSTVFSSHAPDHFALMDLSGDFIYENLSINYFSPMEVVKEVSGSGTFTRDRMDFQIDTGALGSLDMDGGSVSLIELDTDNEHARVEGLVNGDLEELLRIIDEEPLGAATHFGIDHKKSDGVIKAEILFKFPLARTTSVEQVSLLAKGKISDGTFIDLIEGETISNGDLDLVVDTEKLKIAGTVDLYSQKWNLDGESQFSKDPQSFYFSTLSSDNNDFSLNVLFMDNGGYQLDIRGSALSLEQFFEDNEEEQEKDTLDMIVDLKVDQLWFGEENRLVNVSGKAISKNDIWDLVDLEGFSGAGDDSVHFAIERSNGGRSFSLEAKNAGDFLKSIDLYENMKDGSLIFKGSFDDNVADHPFLGNLTIKDYHIVNAPLLTRLVSMASFTGIVDQLSGEGIKFKKFTTPVGYRNDNIKLDKGRAFGNALGYTFSGEINLNDDSCKINGTLVPAYSINSLFEKIPIIGDILGGGRGEGLIAANFQMDGNIDDPDVLINPLSIFTPGILRDLFQVFELPVEEKAGEVEK